MLNTIDTSLIDWSRAQFALTAMYHWIFVPLTLGLAIVMGIMETIYYRTGKQFWKNTTRFWMKIFGINFAVGVATGLILEFEFGTNWSNYSWFVGDIFGAPLAIEGILAFFLEATFIAVMFFGWDKVSRGFHLASTWLVGIGATLSAWWILVANAWMQHPVGMEFNPDTVRNEMVDFMAVAFSPVAVSKFVHTVLSGWVLGGAVVVGISGWYLLKKRHIGFAVSSIKIGAWVGLIGAVLAAASGDTSARHVSKYQPMKLAAMEGLYEGKTHAGLVAIGALNPSKKTYDDGIDPFLFKIELPSLLSLMAKRDAGAFVPGIKDIIEGGYPEDDGSIAPSALTRMELGKTAIAALGSYREAKQTGHTEDAEMARKELTGNMNHFGYGYINDPHELVPNVPLNFYAFHIMVLLGCFFILLFSVTLFWAYRRDISRAKWLMWAGLMNIPLAYIAGHAGWIVAECGRQPWAIQDILPVKAAISKLETSSVQLTFFIFLLLFTVLLIAEIGIILKAIRKGPEDNPLT